MWFIIYCSTYCSTVEYVSSIGFWRFAVRSVAVGLLCKMIILLAKSVVICEG